MVRARKKTDPPGPLRHRLRRRPPAAGPGQRQRQRRRAPGSSTLSPTASPIEFPLPPLAVLPPSPSRSCGHAPAQLPCAPTGSKSSRPWPVLHCWPAAASVPWTVGLTHRRRNHLHRAHLKSSFFSLKKVSLGPLHPSEEFLCGPSPISKSPDRMLSPLLNFGPGPRQPPPPPRLPELAVSHPPPVAGSL
jgi:hypothetical protein